MKSIAPIITALFLVGCASTSDPNVQAADVAAASWQSLDGAVKLVDQAALSGALHGANAARASEDIKKATAALAAADDARTKGNTTSVSSDIAMASTLLAEILLIANNPSTNLPAH